MKVHAGKIQKNNSQAVANAIVQKRSGGDSTFRFVDKRPEAVVQKKLQAMMNKNPRKKQAAHFEVNTIQRAPGTKKSECAELAKALRSWLEIYGVGTKEEAATRLRDNWEDATDLLKALFMSIKINTTSTPGGHAANALEFPNVPPIWRQDMLTMLHDLRTFGPTPTFRPEQTIETVVKWFNALSRQ